MGFTTYLKGQRNSARLRLPHQYYLNLSGYLTRIPDRERECPNGIGDVQVNASEERCRIENALVFERDSSQTSTKTMRTGIDG
jgi:hypothetical protein